LHIYFKFYINLSFRTLTIPPITVPKLATDAFSSSAFETKFDDTSEALAADKTSQLIDEEERHLQALKVIKTIQVI
jgi:hypothetical protein